MNSLSRLFLLLTFCLLLKSFDKTQAQYLDFANAIYWTNPSGNTLTSSGTNLSGFNYVSALPNHPIFASGIFFPVVDSCGNNLWIKIKHIAADPNGTTNGWNVPATSGSASAAPMTIGGWHGFLYDFEIYRDSVLVGSPSNVLDTLYPTDVTVESRETLYNDNSNQAEWLSFVILNTESHGWNLNSINFTGSNPNSNPGFCDSLSYANAPNPLPCFSPAFPSGRDSIYAISLNTNGTYSEFRMSADSVSHFLYGYEFVGSWGYQGMAMRFGCSPVGINEIINERNCYLFPNPSMGVLTIKSNKLILSGKILITNTIGQIVFEENIFNESKKEINLESVSQGIYFVKVFDGESSLVNKIIIARD